MDGPIYCNDYAFHINWRKSGISFINNVSCLYPASSKNDPTIYDPDTDSPIQIPAVCKSAYEGAIVTRVGVVDFTNSFGKVGVPVGWWWRREVEMKLPETVADGVIDEVVNIGGAKVFSRTEMQ